MHFLTVTECRVPLGRMQEFATMIQQWEQDALASPDGPEFHGVYLQSSDPTRVLVITQYTSREAANRFVATGLVQQFRDRVLACTMQVPTDVDGYDLFYSASRSGDNVIFGEDAN